LISKVCCLLSQTASFSLFIISSTSSTPVGLNLEQLARVDGELNYHRAYIDNLQGLPRTDGLDHEIWEHLDTIIKQRILQVHNLKLSTYITDEARAVRVKYHEDQLKVEKAQRESLVETPSPRDEPKHWLGNGSNSRFL
jgi:hypothetical protein